MRTRFLTAGLLLVLLVPAAAQPVSDSAISDYVDAHSATTHLGKIARWEDSVCPGVIGLPAGFTKFMIDRIKTVATTAGVPVDASPACKTNVQIIFTTKPQALLDGIRANEPVLLGYYDSPAQAEKMATVTHPIQSWYTTATIDLRGKPQIDFRHANNNQTYDPMDAQNTTGSHLGDGLRSAFYHVTIIADPSKLGDHEIGALADNIAMLALSQPVSLDTCTALPSIVNLTTPGCHADAPLAAITSIDSGYLKALYHINLGGTLRAQRDGIVFGMKDALAH
jgi:hypothetical protein